MNNRLTFSSLLVLILLMLFGPSVFGQCPDVSLIEPCTCYDTDTDGVSLLTLNCTSKSGLNNTKVDEILELFLIADPSNSIPLGYILLDDNYLQVVPKKIQLFDQLISVSLTENQIATIQSDTFNFGVRAPKTLILSDNFINSIEPGTFDQGNYSTSVIRLDNNRLTRFESDVFQSVLEQMEPNSYPSATGDSSAALTISYNPFDCESDPCHLAWLIRDSPLLLKVLNDTGKCKNTTNFTELDLDDCPLPPETTTDTETSTVELNTMMTTPQTPDATTTTDDLITTDSSSSSNSPPTTSAPPPPVDPETIDKLQTEIIIVASVLGGVVFLLIVFTVYLLATVGGMSRSLSAMAMPPRSEQFLPRVAPLSIQQ